MITVFKGSFTGGVPPVTLATKLQARTAGSSDAFADLTSGTSTTTHTYTLLAADAGKELRATTTATDDDSNTLTNDGDPSGAVAAAISVSTATSFTGLVKIGETLTIAAATGAGGIAPLQYMVQIRLSPTGSGEWVNTNLGNTNTAGETFTYEIPSDAAGKYIQIRTRIRDLNGQGDTDQVFSNAGSNQVIADNVSITTDISYTGFVKIGKDLAVVGATATGGITPLQYLNQVVFNDTNINTFAGTTINMGGVHNTAAFEQDYTIPAEAAGKFMTFRTRVRDNDGGSGYEEVISVGDIVQVADDLATTGDNGTISGVFKAGETLTGLTLATFTGGLAPTTFEAKFQVSDDGSSGWTNFGGDFTSVNAASEMSVTLTASEATKYIRLQTRVTDATGDNLVRAGIVYGPIAAVLAKSGAATLSGTFTVGETVTLTAIPTFTGGVTPVLHEYQWQMSDDGTAWVGFDSAFVEYNPSTVLDSAPTKVLDATVSGKFIRLNARATDASGTVLMAPGTQYGQVAAA